MATSHKLAEVDVRKRKNNNTDSPDNESDKKLKKTSSSASVGKSPRYLHNLRKCSTEACKKDKKITLGLCHEQRERNRLDDFLTVIYNAAKLQESDSDISKQKDYVENVIKELVYTLRKDYPLLNIQDPLPSGSFYNGTKILSPSEFDYSVVLFSSNDQVEISHPNENNEVEIKILDETLKNEIKRSFLNAANQKLVSEEGLLLTNPFRYSQINLIHECLRKLKQKDYVGKYFLIRPVDTLKTLERVTQLRDNSTNTSHRERYEILLGKCIEYRPDVSDIPAIRRGGVILSQSPNGPVVRLRVHGPLGLIDIDLGFCVEISKTDLGRNIAIPLSDDNFFYSSKWACSFYESPSFPRLDEHHRKILIIFKYLFLECKLIARDTFNSHEIKTCVMVHQEVCRQNYQEKDHSLCECFNDIATFMFQQGDLKKDNNEIKISECSHGKLPDINFRGRKVRSKISWHSLLFLYVLTEVVKDASMVSHTDPAIDHRLVLAEILALEKSGRIYTDGHFVHCPLEVLEEMKSKSYTVTV